VSVRYVVATPDSIPVRAESLVNRFSTGGTSSIRQREVARRTGENPWTARNWEKARIKPAAPSIAVIADLVAEPEERDGRDGPPGEQLRNAT
jgi:hypothetical protein